MKLKINFKTDSVLCKPLKINWNVYQIATLIAKFVLKGMWKWVRLFNYLKYKIFMDFVHCRIVWLAFFQINDALQLTVSSSVHETVNWSYKQNAENITNSKYSFYKVNTLYLVSSYLNAVVITESLFFCAVISFSTSITDELFFIVKINVNVNVQVSEYLSLIQGAHWNGGDVAYAIWLRYDVLTSHNCLVSNFPPLS